MQTIIITLDSERMDNPDLDIRYLLDFIMKVNK